MPFTDQVLVGLPQLSQVPGTVDLSGQIKYCTPALHKEEILILNFKMLSLNVRLSTFHPKRGKAIKGKASEAIKL